MTSDLLKLASERASAYLEDLDQRPVAPGQAALDGLRKLEEALPEAPGDAESVLRLLDEVGSPATVASAGRRYFGFVIGGSLPVTVAANWLAGAWDQNVALRVMSPVGAKLEALAERWLVDALHLPAGTGVGFVTGATMANFSGLAAARHALLAKASWDVEAWGLFDAPEITVIVGEEVHTSALKALRLLGLGSQRVTRVAVDEQGRMMADALPPISGPTIVCLQAGNVNTGAFDQAAEIIPRAHEAGAWVHVDGAFGLWAAAAPTRAHLMAGYAEADFLGDGWA